MYKKQTGLIHANALNLGGKGVLILGASGAGKSLLTLTLIERAGWCGRAARLVADDYCELSAQSNKLVARAPEAIRGAIEVRGAGLFAYPYQQQTTLDLAVELIASAPRYPEEHTFTRFGLSLPCLQLPRLDGEATLTGVCHGVEATLFWPRFPLPTRTEKHPITPQSA